MTTVALTGPVRSVVGVTEIANRISVSEAKTFVSIAETSTALVITQPAASSIVELTETGPSVVISEPSEPRIVQISSAGPSGPAFSGVHYFDLDQLNGLGESDAGKVLNWNGNIFVPTDDLSANLTLNGGAF
ncbi:MAG: hypothetical protein CMK37_07560 [Porticoccaceae bacterium]|nr:hypothetical protein [Porticoccaceae bacterium]